METVIGIIFIVTTIMAVIFCAIILKARSHHATAELLEYIKTHYPEKYYQLSMERPLNGLSAFFPAGNPLVMPFFVLSSDNLNDQRITALKSKIRWTYLIGLLPVTLILLGLYLS